MHAVIISCGTEIVTGQCVDTNSAWLSERLTAHGIEVAAHITVGDDLARMTSAIRRAFEETGFVIITGGLGPTRDDVTREALAAALNRPLFENAIALAQINEFFKRWQREMPESNKVQALIPESCEVIPNPRGTAPGIVYWSQAFPQASPLSNGGPRGVIALPGVPGEMKPMFDAYVQPRLSTISTARIMSARLHCYGISEAKLGEMITDLMQRGRNPLVGTTASKAVLTIRILANAPNLEEAQRLLIADQAEIRQRLGSVIFGENDESLQHAVAKLLVQNKKTVATAESCTGGMLAKMLTDISGSSYYFLQGHIVYSNASKSQSLGVSREVIERHGAVSEEVARLLAQNVRSLADSVYALSITGIAGPSGGSIEKPVGLVFIGLADERGVEVRRVQLGDHLSRDEIRDRACKTALNMLRLRLQQSS